MAKPEFKLAEGVTEVVDIDAWSLPLLEERAAETRDWESIYLAGVVALRMNYGIEVEEFDEDIS